MPNPLSHIVERMTPGPKARQAWAHWRQELVGLAQDYWKDGHWDDPADDDLDKHIVEPPLPAYQEERQADDLWHALPGEISEKMWGNGYVTPGDEYITDILIKPLGITRDMNLLDLSAGLGGRLRRVTDEFGVYITGLEPDPEVAARGMAMSVAAGRGKHVAIAAYDPMSLKSARSYDCVVARETIYRVPDKEKFIKLIAACCKSKAQVSFTDYVVNPESRANPAIAAWRAFEKGADPASLVEMAEMWAKAGVSIRIHDDQTDYYKKEVKKGLIAFAKFMASGVKPDAATRKAIEKRITVWAHRTAAMEQGMKFYRFYGLR